MALKNSEKQRRYRELTDQCIHWYERKTNMPINKLRELIKFHNKEKELELCDTDEN